MRQPFQIVAVLSATLAISLANDSVAQTCRDSHEHCQDWAASAECENNPDYMTAVCQKSCNTCPEPIDPKLIALGPERVILEVAVPNKEPQEIELGFFPNAAPVTVAHIVSLFREGCYDTNHIFRIDKGFVAQVQFIHPSTVTKLLSNYCLNESQKTVPAEFTVIPHQRGILSMGRRQDPNSGGSSFSMLLGNAPHLDQQYTVFGKVLRGDSVLSELELLETTKEGIFVMPMERVAITRAWVVNAEGEKEL